MQILKRGRADGPSGMRSKELKEWLREASRETNPVTHRLRMLVRLVQNTFKDGTVTEEVAWATMVFFPKVRGGVLGDRSS